MHNEQHDLDLFFLGPKSEQRQFLEEVLKLVLNDHVFWRRNYYPKDPPAIPYRKVHGEQARHFREEFYTELFQLISELKLDVPVFSPRYAAHMISETNLPSLVSYFATLLYNPNNVSSEASPVTIRYELQVGQQFARLFGFDAERSFGHLTSGGTVANYESLWYTMAGRTLPVSIAMAGGEGTGARDAGVRDAGVRSADGLWALMNVPLPEVEERLATYLAPDPEARYNALRPHLQSQLGLVGFARTVETYFDAEWKPPVLVAPRTAHYSWARALPLLGLGKSSVRTVAVDNTFRMVPGDFERVLRACQAEQRPVWQTVAVAGTTEFGTIDPVGALADIRDRLSAEGLYTPIHVDAAYGGYFATMYRDGEEAPVGVAAVGAAADGAAPGSAGEPTDAPPGGDTAEAYRALHRADSVTVDPHKAGYTPYGAGSIIIKHGFLKDLVAETAPYCLDRHDTTEAESPRPQLGKFILEGSKPGAAAASVWFSHKLIPLNMDGYGRQLATLCRLTRDVDARVAELGAEGAAADAAAAALAPRMVSLYRPQLNLLCLLAVPPSAAASGAVLQGGDASGAVPPSAASPRNLKLSRVNALNEALAERFGVREVMSIQSYDYLVSRTTVASDMAAIEACEELAHVERDAPAVTVLRLVFMNRWFEGLNEHGESYRENFLSVLCAEAARLWESL